MLTIFASLKNNKLQNDSNTVWSRITGARCNCISVLKSGHRSNIPLLFSAFDLSEMVALTFDSLSECQRLRNAEIGRSMINNVLLLRM